MPISDRRAPPRCQELFDNIDGGETLAFQDGGTHFYRSQHRDLDDPEQLADAMCLSAEFFHVPRSMPPHLLHALVWGSDAPGLSPVITPPFDLTSPAVTA
jgi:hypothetical protein